MKNDESRIANDEPRYSSGFTLVEALVSLVLLTTALVPAFILATDALKLSTGIRNSLIAANLAQEGIEVVRAMRDANWFAGQPFSAGLDGVCTAGCLVAWDSSSPTPNSNNVVPLKRDTSSGLYQYSTGTDSPFRRKITITPGTTDVELVVTSEVTWDERAVTKIVIVEAHLFDWIK